MRVNNGNRTPTNNIIGGTTSGVTFNVTLGSSSNSVIATISSSEAPSGKLFGRLSANE